MQRIWLSGSAVCPPLMWPTTSVSASSTTSLSMRPEPGIDGPPVWMVLWMPYLRAQATMRFAVGPSFTPPRPTSPSSVTPASARSLKSCSVISGSMQGAPAWTLTPEGRKLANWRCAEMASALRPTTSRGRPGVCTSPAEIMVVTPPLRFESIQPSWFWRGVQSPATGCTWLSIRPGRERRAIGIDDERGMLLVHVLRAADRRDAAVLGHHRVGIEDGVFQRARQQKPDVADHQLLRPGGRALSVMRHDVLLQARCFWGSFRAAYCDRRRGLSRAGRKKMRIIRRQDFREGRWRNGMGVSWDIASDPPGTEDFGWRFATARIEADVPFSLYPDVDRIFTLIAGQGLDLDFEGRPGLAVDRLFVPHPYPCDVPTFCRLRGGPCRALNLFTRRGRWSATADILSSGAEIAHDGPILLFALEGAADVDGAALGEGDAAIDGRTM